MNQKIFTLTFVLLLFSQSVYALGERVTEFADKVANSVGIGMTATVIDRNVDKTLNKLFNKSPAAVELSKKAEAILVFPEILKAGFGVGGHHGEGALRKKGKTFAYYSTFSGSYGLQIGAQSFGYAMFFMDNDALKYLNSSEGWEVGVGPSVVMIDEGLAKTLTTTTIKNSVYVFSFNQKGLMAGLGIQGSKITQITPEK